MMPALFSQLLGPFLFGFISFFLLRYCICLAAKLVRSTIVLISRNRGLRYAIKKLPKLEIFS